MDPPVGVNHGHVDSDIGCFVLDGFASFCDVHVYVRYSSVGDFDDDFICSFGVVLRLTDEDGQLRRIGDVYFRPGMSQDRLTDAVELFQHCDIISVHNGPGPRQGPAGGLPRAPDGTGRQNAVHTRPSNLRTAVLMEDGGPCEVRHFSVGDFRGLPGTTGDCGGLWGTAGDYRGLPGTTRDYESYQRNFTTPSLTKYRNSSNNIKRNLRQSSRDK